MKTVKDIIDDKLNEIVSDERLSYPTATIVENAPLALIQLELSTKRDTLLWVLKIIRNEEISKTEKGE